MKPSLQLKFTQQLALTPQLQQSIRLLQLSTIELNQELEQALADNPLLERLDEPLLHGVSIAPNGGLDGQARLREDDAEAAGSAAGASDRLESGPAGSAAEGAEAAGEEGGGWDDPGALGEWSGTSSRGEEGEGDERDYPQLAGAGLSLAFIADMCIAASDARFTAAYNKIAVSPDGGGTVGVTEIVGSRRALQIFLAEDSFSAAHAYEWGLLAKVVPPDELKQATRELAQRIARNAPASIKTTKELIHAASSTTLVAQLEAEANGIAACMQTEAYRTAVAKFLGKTK